MSGSVWMIDVFIVDALAVSRESLYDACSSGYGSHLIFLLGNRPERNANASNAMNMPAITDYSRYETRNRWK